MAELQRNSSGVSLSGLFHHESAAPAVGHEKLAGRPAWPENAATTSGYDRRGPFFPALDSY